MKIAKTIVLFLLAWVFALVSTPAGAVLMVFACEPEWAALVQELGGEQVKVFSATTAQQDPHRIEARPSLIARLRQADLMVCTGAELEIGWAPVLQRQAGNPKVQPGRPGYFEAAGFVTRLDIPAVLDRALGDIHVGGNPHVHTDPRRILTIASRLTERLATLDPTNAEHYRRRLETFSSRWREAMARWSARGAPLKGVRAVAYHKDWIYLYDWLGMQDGGTLEPKPGIPPTAGHIATLKAQLERTPASVIIRGPYQDPRPAQWLSEQTRLPVVVLPYTVGGTPQAKDLFGLFEDTVERLLAALPRTADPVGRGTGQ